MLFMGEEWRTARPFPFFCDPARRAGHRLAEIPDPQSDATFPSAKLDWSEPDRPEHRATLEWYRRILTVRRAKVAPLAAAMPLGGRYTLVGPLAVDIRWPTSAGTTLRLQANLKAGEQSGFDAADGEVIWTEGAAAAASLDPWSVRWSVL